MQKPQIQDFGLDDALLKAAKDAELRREMAKDRSMWWVFGIPMVGFFLWLVAVKKLHMGLAVLLGFFGGGVLSMVFGAVVLIAWELLWAKSHPAEARALADYKKYQAALKAFEMEELRRLSSFWSGLSGKAFEQELALLFTRLGYAVNATRYSRDGGVDIFIKKAGRSTIVQCKRYRNPVGVAVVRELYGVLQSSDAQSAILASTGGFTKGVVEFAKGKPIQLMDLARIIELQKSVDPLAAVQR